MQIFPIKDDLQPRFYEEFARLVVAFGRVEYLIKLCVKDLLAEGFTKGMIEAESQPQFRELCKKARMQANNKLPSMDANAFSHLIDLAEALAEFRNDAVHAFWTTDPNGQPLRIRPKREKHATSVNWGRSQVVPLYEIQNFREQIEDLYQALEAKRKIWSTHET